MINSRSLDDLHPIVKALALKFQRACAAEGIDIIFTSTHRDNESQAALYAVGRTVKGANASLLKPMGSKVTNANAGGSFHNHRVAFDFCPLVNGKPMWNDTATFKRCGAIAEFLGLEWAGRWKTFPELAHCQFLGGLTLADFKAGKTLKDAA